MDVVYARNTGHYASPAGHSVLIVMGQHWPANDPMVLQYPDAFTDDPRMGLQFSTTPVVTEPAITDPNPKPAPTQKRVESATSNPGEARKVTK